MSASSSLVFPLVLTALYNTGNSRKHCLMSWAGRMRIRIKMTFLPHCGVASLGQSLLTRSTYLLPMAGIGFSRTVVARACFLHGCAPGQENSISL